VGAAWRLPEQAFPLAGFSHGACGIALALARLGDRTGDARYLATAEEALAYERSLYDHSERNWPDLRQTTPGARPKFLTTWCHGAPGIALGRVELPNVTLLPEVLAETSLALETTAAVGIDAVDHLCCGGLGRADILLEAGMRLASPGLVSASRRLVSTVTARADSEKAFRLFPDIERTVFNPGMFKGMAGIGYALLRQVRPSLPCVLSLA
jgi:lantibiotic modifying enzyme